MKKIILLFVSVFCAMSLVAQPRLRNDNIDVVLETNFKDVVKDVDFKEIEFSKEIRALSLLGAACFLVLSDACVL